MKAVLIMSGGMDSGVLLAKLKADGADILGLSFNYGQRHSKELVAACLQAARYDIRHRVVDLRSITPLIATSSQTSADIDVPEGHYAEESMKKTVVPNRNMIMLSVAAGAAIAEKADALFYAAHNGDHAIYPDCRPEFVRGLNNALVFADWHCIQVEAPFLAMSKADIAKLGHDLGFDFTRSWSCYKGGAKHCGKCGTCTERAEAFQLAGVPDPTEYE